MEILTGGSADVDESADVVSEPADEAGLVDAEDESGDSDDSSKAEANKEPRMKTNKVNRFSRDSLSVC